METKFSNQLSQIKRKEKEFRKSLYWYQKVAKNEITYHNRIRKNAQFRITKNMVWIRNLHGIYMEFT
ncbi:hypothetical protein GLOIN_2v1739917 [Rhizophagus irregularis DAOM 181602=DAOM 197198]|nr:hypothetical protein GLOIN_2v1739917 [Rhizophagus irregularis DAOM 181602=DAOM 197198]